MSLQEPPRVGLLSVCFSLFDAQMGVGFRSRLEATAESYRRALSSEADIVYPGLVASDADGRRANEAFRQARVSAVVFAPAMAAPPSYAAHALSGLSAPVMIWNAPTVDTLGMNLDQAGAHEHTSVISAIMLGNTLFRQGSHPVVVTASPSDKSGMDRVRAKLRAVVAGSVLRGRVVLRVGAPIEGYLDVEASCGDLAVLGVREQEVGEAELIDAVERVTPDGIGEVQADVRARGWIGEVDARSARLAVALQSLADRYDVVGGTVNCHGPLFRFSRDVGVCACLGVSLSTARGVPFSCTGDQPTAIALVLGRAIAGAALYCEFYAPELSTGLSLVGNGGEGDPAWADGVVEVMPNAHYPGIYGRGSCLSFALKPGACSVLSLSPGPNGWRGAWARASVIESRYPAMHVPNAMIRFSRESDSGVALDRWAASGASHHHALLPGAAGDRVRDVLTIAGIEVIEAV